MYRRHVKAETKLGELTIVAADKAVVGLYFPEHWVKPDYGSFGERVDAGSDTLLGTAISQLHEYLDGERRVFDVPVSLAGDDFQERVWKILEDIPFGTTTTYGDIASQLGDLTLARLVGQAVGHNPVGIFVPCHRVIGRNGALTGYAGGLARKELLLQLEGAHYRPEPELVEAGKLF